MNGLKVRSKIYVWVVSLCFVGLLGAAVVLHTFDSIGLNQTLLDLPAVAGDHIGSNGSGGG